MPKPAAKPKEPPAGPIRTPEKALAEFRYACNAWFACMDEETRQSALAYAGEAAKTVPFKPNHEPV